MKQLVCEMCGSKDLIKDDGVFVCQSCGCKYSVEEAKKLLIEGVEIKGTVNVSGTVKMDRSEEIENLLFRAKQFCNEGDMEKSKLYFNKVLDIDFKNDDALNGLNIIDKITIKDLLDKAKQFYNQGDITNSELYFHKILDIDAENQDALNGLDIIDKNIIEPNLIISRANIRPSGEYKTIVVINGKKHKELDLDYTARVKLPAGNHIIFFKRAALKSNSIAITVNSRKDKFSLTFEPKLFTIKTNLIKTN